MHGKNTLPVKLKDLQKIKEHIYKMAWTKHPSLVLPSLSRSVKHIALLSSKTTLTNASGTEPLPQCSARWLASRPDHTKDTAQQNTEIAFRGGKSHFTW